MTAAEVIAGLRGGLVVSCQPVPGSPFDTAESVVKFALAARNAGARALRIEGIANVAAVTRACDLPVIGLVKRDLDDSPVRITPFGDDIAALAAAGASIIAFDATERVRPVPVAALLAGVRATGRLAMADISTLDEARAAMALGFDLIGTTLSGYTDPSVTPEQPDLALVRAVSRLGLPVIAEGRYNAPALAAAALRAGAHAVVVGSAITRPEYVTEWFATALARVADPRPVLAIDIGGSKIAVALVADGRIVARRLQPTDPQAGPMAWLDVAMQLAGDWPEQCRAASAAVSGIVDAGIWSSANPATLAVPDGFPLQADLHRRTGLAAFAVNDAQAAAWGEYRHGDAAGQDLVFLTISSGIGGGIVSQGRLLTGAHGRAGHVGQFPVMDADGRMARLEDCASGFAVARRAAALGHAASAREVFDMARAGNAWADAIVAESMAVLAAFLPGLQATLDPAVMVIGGGVGLADGYLPRLQGLLDAQPPLFRPRLLAARLAGDAGLLGAADLAITI